MSIHFMLEALLSCEHENTGTFMLQRHGTRLQICTDCGARREPDSSRPEWRPAEYVHALQLEANRQKAKQT